MSKEGYIENPGLRPLFIEFKGVFFGKADRIY